MGINFGKSVGGGSLPLKLRVVIKSKSKAVEIYICRFLFHPLFFLRISILYTEGKCPLFVPEFYYKKWVLHPFEHSTLFSVDVLLPRRVYGTVQLQTTTIFAVKLPSAFGYPTGVTLYPIFKSDSVAGPAEVLIVAWLVRWTT